MYFNCLLSSLCGHKFWDPADFFMLSETQDKNLNILRTKRAFKVKWKGKKLRKIFLKGFQLPKIVSDMRVRL